MSSQSAPVTVTIFDEVILPLEATAAWIERWRAEYLPDAMQRGLQLRGAWRGSTDDPDHAVVVFQWTLATVEAFFAYRGQSGADRSVTEFWDATDKVAISRNRRVLADAGIAP